MSKIKNPFCLIIVVAFLLLSLSNVLVAESKPYLYVSPGLQIGYGGEGFFRGGQISIGAISQVEGECQCWTPFVPAVSYGIRFYKEYQMRYLDGQLGFIYGGLGFGRARRIWKTRKQLPAEVAKGFRFKVWAGALYYGTWDVTKFPQQNMDFNFGSIVVMPLSVREVSDE